MRTTRLECLQGFFFLIISLDRKVFADIGLTPKDGSSVVNRSFKFNCSYNTSVSPFYVNWKREPLNAYVLIKDCKAAGFLNNETLYETSCGLGWVTVKIYNVSLNNHGDIWSCADDRQARSNLVTLYVKVPVKTVTLISNDAHIRENTSANFNCTTSPSRPPPFVLWFLTDPNNNARENVTEKASAYAVNSTDGLKSAFSTISISFWRKYNAWTISCVSLNMDLPGNVTSKPKYLSILYPASVEELLDETVLEGHSKTITCRVRPGNPGIFQVSWTPPKGTYGYSKDNGFHISNISRKNEGIYTCYVTTTMTADNGQSETITEEGGLYLSVEYKAVVTEFYGYLSKKGVYTVDENADAVLSCIIDGKPSPSVNISYKGGIVQRFEINKVRFTKVQMQCTDSGIYMCTGANKYNKDLPSSKTLQVLVNCSPRPSQNVALIKRIAITKYSEAELNFTATAHPKPSFKWYFVNASQMIFLKNDSNLFVLSSGVHTKLILTNLAESSYGQYLLVVENTFGTFQQNFRIERQDIPTSQERNDMTGIYIGIICSILTVIGISFGIVIFLYKKRNVRSSCYEAQTRVVGDVIGREMSSTVGSQEYTDLDSSKRDLNAYDTVHNPSTSTYETLSIEKQRSSTYTELTDKNALTTEISDYVNVRI